MSPNSSDVSTTSDHPATPNNARSLARRRLQLRHSLTSPSAIISPLSHTPRRLSADSDSTMPRKTPGSELGTDCDSAPTSPRGDTTPTRRYGALPRVASPERYRSFSARSPSPGTARRGLAGGARRNRSTEDAAQRYIDYLEKQLSDVQDDLAKFTERKGGEASLEGRVKKLETENRRLLQALGEWEGRFEERVSAEVEERAAVDRELRRRVEELEGELDDFEVERRTADREIAGLRGEVREWRGRWEEAEEERRRLEDVVAELEMRAVVAPLKVAFAADSRPATADSLAYPAGDSRPVTSDSRAYPPADSRPVTADSRPLTSASSQESIGGISDFGISNDPTPTPTPSSTTPTPTPRRLHPSRPRHPIRNSLILPADSFHPPDHPPSRPASAASLLSTPPLPAPTLFSELAAVDSDTDSAISTSTSRLPPVITKVLDRVSHHPPIASARSRASSLISSISHTRDDLASTRLRAHRVGAPLLRSPRASPRCPHCGREQLRASSNPQRRAPGKQARAEDRDWEDSLDTLWLWLRVVIAVVVALGVAVREGPAAVVCKEGEEGIDHVREEERERALRRLEAREGRGLGLEGWDE